MMRSRTIPGLRLTWLTFPALLLLLVGPVGGAEKRPQLLLPFGHTGPVEAVAWSPDGKRIVTASFDMTARVWDVETGKLLFTFSDHRSHVSCVAWSPDGTRILSGSNDQTARTWDAVSGKGLLTLVGHTDKVTEVAWSPDGKRILTGSRDRTARLWDATSGKCLFTLSGHTDSVMSVAWSPDGKRAATASRETRVRVWDTENGSFLSGQSLDTSDSLRKLTSVAWSPDGKRILTGLGDQTLQLWEAATGKPLQTLTDGQRYLVPLVPPADPVAWSPNGDCILAFSSHRRVRLWDASSGRFLRSIGVADHDVTSPLAWNPQGTRILGGSIDGAAKVWDAANGLCLQTISGRTQATTSVAWNPEGTCVVTGSRDTTARVWDVVNGRHLLTLAGHTKEVTSVAWSPNGKKILTGSNDRTARLWGATEGNWNRTLSGHEYDVYSVAWSPDSSRVLTGSMDRTARLWDAHTGASLHTLTGHSGAVISVAWSPDSKRILTGSDRSARLWDAQTGAALLTLSGHSEIKTVAWNPDSRRCLVTPYNGRAQLWDAESGRSILTFPSGTRWIYAVAWSPECKQSLARPDVSEVRLSDHDPRDCLHTFGQQHDITQVAFSRPRRTFATSSYDGTTSFWKPDRPDPVYSFLYSRNDWLAWTPEGYYTCSPGGEKLLAWKIDDPAAPGGYRIVEPEQFRKTFHRPDLFAHLLTEPDLASALAKADRQRGRLSTASNIADELPPVVIIASPLQARSTVKTSKCEIAVKARGIGNNHVSALQLLVGGRPYNGGRARFQVATPRPGEASARWTIDLEPGENTVQVVAESVKGSRSRPEEAQVVIVREDEPVELPTLFLLGVGVSDYMKVDRKGVEHTASDARRFLEAQAKHSGALYQKVEKVTLIDGKATKADILDAFDDLSKKARGVRKAVVMIFLAGHGKVSELGDFHFLAADSDPKRLRATALGSGELKSALKDIPGRVILYLDACHSGAFAGDATRSTGLTDDLVSELTAPDCGVVVVCSSRGKEVSQQSYEQKAGYFTLALEEGLSGKAVPVKGGKAGETYRVARSPNGAVYLPELFAFVNRRVKELSEGQQNPYASELKKVGELPLTRP